MWKLTKSTSSTLPPREVPPTAKRQTSLTPVSRLVSSSNVGQMDEEAEEVQMRRSAYDPRSRPLSRTRTPNMGTLARAASLDGQPIANPQLKRPKARQLQPTIESLISQGNPSSITIYPALNRPTKRPRSVPQGRSDTRLPHDSPPKRDTTFSYKATLNPIETSTDTPTPVRSSFTSGTTVPSPMPDDSHSVLILTDPADECVANIHETDTRSDNLTSNIAPVDTTVSSLTLGSIVSTLQSEQTDIPRNLSNSANLVAMSSPELMQEDHSASKLCTKTKSSIDSTDKSMASQTLLTESSSSIVRSHCSPFTRESLPTEPHESQPPSSPPPLPLEVPDTIKPEVLIKKLELETEHPVDTPDSKAPAPKRESLFRQELIYPADSSDYVTVRVTRDPCPLPTDLTVTPLAELQPKAVREGRTLDRDTRFTQRRSSSSSRVRSRSLPSRGSLKRFASLRQSKRQQDRIPLVSDIRQKFEDQLRSLDSRVDAQTCLLQELNEFCSRRAEVEVEYARALDGLVKNTLARHKLQQNKRETWHQLSVFDTWHRLLAAAKQQARDHAALSVVLSGHVAQQLSSTSQHTSSLYNKCRDIGVLGQEEILKVLGELQNAMVTYQKHTVEAESAQGKLNKVHSQYEKAAPKKAKSIEKSLRKSEQKFTESAARAERARNEYLLNLAASNASTKHFFNVDMSNLIDMMDACYHDSISQALRVLISGESQVKQSLDSCVDALTETIAKLEPLPDKRTFLQDNTHAFAEPLDFEFQAHGLDETKTIQAENSDTRTDLQQRMASLHDLAKQLSEHNDETLGCLKASERNLLERLSQPEGDPIASFRYTNSSDVINVKESYQKRYKGKRNVETDPEFVEKFRTYLLNSNRLARISAKHQLIGSALANEVKTDRNSSEASIENRDSTINHNDCDVGLGDVTSTKPLLFGGSLEEYTKSTGQEIPLVVESCIRTIRQNGMKQKGIFRVSGSQVEINIYKAAFERGEDPLESKLSGRDLNSVAGLLKLYLRELREPLIPQQYFDDFVEATGSDDSCVSRVKDLVSNLARSAVALLRYLFAFLNHLSEFSADNMMDPYNIAICFAPTLLPIPHDKDQMTHQTPVINLIKTLIDHYEEIFPQSTGKFYQRSTNSTPHSSESSKEESFSDTDILASAKFDFAARTKRELTFKRGDMFVLHRQVSLDWWEATCKGQRGLVPCKYIHSQARVPTPSVSSERTPDLVMDLPSSSTSDYPLQTEPGDLALSSTDMSKLTLIDDKSKHSREDVFTESATFTPTTDSILPSKANSCPAAVQKGKPTSTETPVTSRSTGSGVSSSTASSESNSRSLVHEDLNALQESRI